MRTNTSNILVAFLTLVALFCLTGFQVTSETSSERLLGRLGSAMVELDRWLPAHRGDIELLARDRPDEPLVLTGLPIEVAIPASVALEAPEHVLKATIAEAMGERLYDGGYEVIQDEQGESHLGLTEPLRWAIDGLDSSAHGFWRIALLLTGLALVVTMAGVLWGKHSPFPGFTVGAGIAVVLSLAAWLLVTFLGSSVEGALDEELAQVTLDGIWIGLRNSFAATAIGLGALYVYASFVGPREPQPQWDEWDDYDYEDYDNSPRQAPPY